MATIVNSTPTDSGSNNGFGFLMGVILLIVFAVVFFVYLLPALTHGIGGGTQVSVPSDINVHTSK